MFLLNLRNFVPILNWTLCFILSFTPHLYGEIIALSLLEFMVASNYFSGAVPGHLTCERACTEYEISALYWTYRSKKAGKKDTRSIKCQYQMHMHTNLVPRAFV